MGWSDGGAFCEDHAQEVVWYAEEDCAFDEVDDCLCDEEEAKDRARMLRVDFDGHTELSWRLDFGRCKKAIN